MPKKIEYYICNECGRSHSSYDEAILCEKRDRDPSIRKGWSLKQDKYDIVTATPSIEKTETKVG